MSDEDIALDEKRVFEGRRGTSFAFVTSEIGLARVAVSDDQIGRFGLVHRGETRDVAVDPRDGAVVVAVDGDVFVGDSGVRGGNEAAVEPTDFAGDAVAVSVADAPLAVDSDGHVARFESDGWTTIGAVAPPVVAADGDLVATADGVARVTDDVGPVGGEIGGAIRDVAAGGPSAATDRGVVHFVDGEWTREANGDATAIASAGERAVAVLDGTVVERTGEDWQALDAPADGIVGLAVGRAIYAVTADGTLLVDPPTAKDGTTGWATRSLGLPGARAIAVLDGEA